MTTRISREMLGFPYNEEELKSGIVTIPFSDGSIMINDTFGGTYVIIFNKHLDEETSMKLVVNGETTAIKTGLRHNLRATRLE